MGVTHWSLTPVTKTLVMPLLLSKIVLLSTGIKVKNHLPRTSVAAKNIFKCL